MPKLGADDCFNNVLERLLDLQRSTATDAENARISRQSAEGMRAEVTRLTERLQTKVLDDDKVLAKLAELYASAETAFDYLRGVEKLDDAARAKMVARLMKALTESRDHCDQLPF